MIIKNSARLSFRLMESQDAQLLWQLDQDPEVMHFLNGGQPTSMTSINEVFIPRMNAYRDSEKGFGLWHVSDKNSREYFGWILARPMDFFSDKPDLADIELGWRFFKKTWGKGYATEAAIAIKNSLATQANIQSFSALALEDNIASIAVMKKMGMCFKKKYDHHTPLGNFIAVHYQMAIK
ncbi:GNAT family N-acetyltransferase [Colwellia sp. 1_MG-2023]|uniref:GNAT family N-acetyltransferase n=1 Tax=unclassified Colwellia TaxID=196834 RepID=UPI001C09E90D|nr:MULTISPECIES: GNAT family N-acetyltransferase [unclassified Colwellia]MBU2926169.1 GNAT family N-acetyltransferase [Colwellia sp. C2M11]MDO6652410.1 GNAT family N-acetyltransferase [Colwellia sp. 3_MG-2023]MDO6665715.1 GNAT family N-acetyltransferase [Colwellia sp. 2_MG-2023]MDO6690088.1 GNAT family N-acetyltransferase [Colwellia sp. 1_MG-2023]